VNLLVDNSLPIGSVTTSSAGAFSASWLVTAWGRGCISSAQTVPTKARTRR
jgi:hypothetical protein